MKKIIKKLKKLYPDKFITITNKYKLLLFGTDDKITEVLNYEVYIADMKFKHNNNSAVSSPFNSLHELNDMLESEIKGYKR